MNFYLYILIVILNKFMNQSQNKKKISKGKKQCKGFGKCITLEMEVFEDDTVIDPDKEKECIKCDSKSTISDIFKTHSADARTENGTENDKVFKEDNDYQCNLPTLKTIFRYETNEKCKYKCKLQKCENYTKCGSTMPQWMLNLGRGYCEECNYEINGNVSILPEKLRRYTI